MALGPSRRSKNRLALDTSSSSAIAKSELAECRPSSPNRKYRISSGPRKGGLPQTSDYYVWKSSRRRVPFIFWMASISIYCCIMVLHMRSYRTIGKTYDHRPFFNPDIDEAYQNTRVLSKGEEPKSLKKEAVVTGENVGTIASLFDRDHTTGVDVVHIVETRFMQGQSRLLELGLARLVLFQAFCLPSMISQTSDNFIWIIRADPDLHPEIAQTMVQMLEEKENFVLLGSNSNPEGFGRTMSPFHDFLGGAPVWAGNISLVEEAYEKAAAGAVLLETRLDADDGLHHNFIEIVQMEANRNLVIGGDVKESRKLWRLWCIHSTIEWHPLNPYPLTPEIIAANETMSEGYLIMYTADNHCSTPGLTFGYGLGANRASLGFDHLRHDEIAKKISACERKTDKVEVECVSRLTELAPGGAIRARTATSAGMSNVIIGDERIDSKVNVFKQKSKTKKMSEQYFKQKQMWGLLARDFSVDYMSARAARSNLIKRMKFIAEENMKGQCSPGHSCKKMTKALLQKISDASDD